MTAPLPAGPFPGWPAAVYYALILCRLTLRIMPYYRHHVFFCTNQRDDGSPCCQDFSARQARDYVKQKTKELGLHGPGACRINSAGCLDRCDEGPVIVVYPEGVWYTYVDHEDLDELIEKQIKNGEIVERLRLPDRKDD